MELDTSALRRLRDRLLETPEPASGAVPAGEAVRRVASARLTPSQQAALERIAPLAEVLFLTSAADGDLASEEGAAIRSAIATPPRFASSKLPYAVSTSAAVWRPSSSIAVSRISTLRTFPVTVIGKPSTNFT